MIYNTLRLILFACLLLLPTPGWGATFGDTTDHSGSFFGSSAGIFAVKFTAPGTAGTITKLTVMAADQAAGSHALGVALYSDSSGPSVKLAEDSGNATVSGTTPTWYDVNINYTFSAGEVLWFAVWGGDSANHEYYFNIGTTNQMAYAFGGTFETWPTPATAGGFLDRTASVYATYTAAGGASPSRMMMGVGQ